MKNLKPILIIFLFWVSACVQNDETYLKLVELDTLVFSTYNDSCAKIIFDDIETENLSQKNKAYYNLLITGYNYSPNIPQKSDSLINFSIDYYTKTSDNHKLAYSYYFRAVISPNKFSEKALLDLKKAETLAKETDDYALLGKIYGGLTTFYGNSLEYNEALKYGRKLFYFANKTSNEKLKALALIDMSVCYDKNGLEDSLTIFAKASEKYADKLTPYYRSYIYYNLGAAFFKRSPSEAENYLKKSLECEKHSRTYKLLSDLYLSQNQKEKAKNLWDDAMKNSWSELKTEILHAKADYEFENGDFDAFKTTKNEEIDQLKAYHNKRQENKAIELGKKYDFQLQEEKFRLRLTYIIISAFLLSVVFFLFYKSRTNRLKKERAEYELSWKKEKDTLKKMETDLEVLKKDKKSKTKEIAVLEKRLAQLKNDYQEKLRTGKNLFEKLKENFTPLKWSDKEVLCFWEYVSVSEKEFYDRAETLYDNLSYQQKIFLTAWKLFDKDDYLLCKIFGLEKGSLRQKKIRINSKYLL